MSNPQQRSDQGRNIPAPPPAEFNIMRVLSTVLVLAAIGGGGYAAFQFLGPGGAKLVRARGQVMWKGKPVTVGAVMTEHVDDRTQAAIGALDNEGRFELDTNGEIGAMPGKHKLAVAAFLAAGPAPIPVVPAHYTSINSTPIVVTISTDPDKNDLSIVLEGDLPSRPSRPPAKPEAEESPAETDAAAKDTPSAETPAAETPPAETPPAETPPADAPPAESPPAETPAAETPAEAPATQEQPAENPAP